MFNLFLKPSLELFHSYMKIEAQLFIVVCLFLVFSTVIPYLVSHYIYLLLLFFIFIFGCVGSSFLCEGFL